MSIMIILFIALIATWTIKQLVALIVLMRDIENGKSWEKVAARVLDARVLDKKEASQAKFTSFRRSYFFAIYNYNGRGFGIKKTSFYPGETSADRAYVSKISSDKQVNVYVNPKMPHQAVLVPPANHNYTFLWLKMMTGIILIFIIPYFMAGQL